MEFGPVPIAAAQGAILAHAVPLPGGRITKGSVLGTVEIAALAAAGITDVTVARLAPGDVDEMEAARRLGAVLAGPGLRASPPVNGRVNLHATCTGIVGMDVPGVHALNAIDPALTLATLPPFVRVAAGTLVATVKIIAYAVAGPALALAEARAAGVLAVRPVVVSSAGLLLTRVPGGDGRLEAKGRRAVEARLTALGMTLAGVETVAHRVPDMAGALARLPGAMVLILTGSATSDLRDTGPEAVRAAGGRIARFGMPVDPGNLLFHGDIGHRKVIGLPGCARSPALNGADWVLERLACGLDLGVEDIAAMGVGGLLKESPARPSPREGAGRHGKTENLE